MAQGHSPGEFKPEYIRNSIHKKNLRKVCFHERTGVSILLKTAQTGLREVSRATPSGSPPGIRSVGRSQHGRGTGELARQQATNFPKTEGRQLPSAKSPASQLETAAANDDSIRRRPCVCRIPGSFTERRPPPPPATPRGPVAHPILLVTCIMLA